MEPSTLKSARDFPPAIGVFSRPRPSFTIKREIGVGTLLQIAAMLLSAIWFADRFTLKQEAMAEEIHTQSARIERIEGKLDRIEKYLSSKDSRYWQTVAELQKTNEGQK